MKKMFRFVALFVSIAVLASAAAFYLRRNEISGAGDTNPEQIAGMLLAVEKGCNACHSFDGSAGIGPSWKGTYGTLRLMTDGSQRVADDAYIRESMLAPAAAVVADFQNIMVPAELSEAEIAQLILLIRNLGTSAPE
jgi:cytochrome c oxidase subunit II